MHEKTSESILAKTIKCNARRVWLQNYVIVGLVYNVEFIINAMRRRRFL